VDQGIIFKVEKNRLYESLVSQVTLVTPTWIHHCITRQRSKVSRSFVKSEIRLLILLPDRKVGVERYEPALGLHFPSKAGQLGETSGPLPSRRVCMSLFAVLSHFLRFTRWLREVKQLPLPDTYGLDHKETFPHQIVWPSVSIN
jgi:hypothetical protein